MSGLHWDEPQTAQLPAGSDAVVDLCFSLTPTSIPSDHASLLSQAVCAALPWLTETPDAGLHLIHGAASGNGWQRPEGAGATLYLSKRARLILRLPRVRVADARRLSGVRLDLDKNVLAVGDAGLRRLIPFPTLYAHYVVDRQDDGEPAFLDRAALALAELGVSTSKLLCGRSHGLTGGRERILTRSLMAAELRAADSLRLQQLGLGPGRLLGCGLFVPHKDMQNQSKNTDAS